MVDVLPPVLQEYVYDEVPPETLTLAVPFEPPLQLVDVAVAIKLNAVGSVTTTVAVAVHELASVAVTVYVPAVRPVIVEDDPPEFQTKPMEPVPPDADAEAVPSFPP